VDIIIPASNPKNGDVAYFKAIPDGEEDCFFRGARRLDLKLGDKIFIYAGKALHGWIEFVRYDDYEGEDLQGQKVSRSNALYVRGPLYVFDPPFAVPPDESFNRCRYVDGLPQPVRAALAVQVRLARERREP
jgi:hypothetical protein